MEQLVGATRSEIVELGVAEEKVFVSNARTAVSLHTRQLQIFLIREQRLATIISIPVTSQRVEDLVFRANFNV